MSGYNVPDESNHLHVIPMDDLRPHDTSRACWCAPTQDDEEPAVWVHHSMDGREHTKEKGSIQ